MKKLFITLFLAVMAIGANAQVTWNVRAGVALANGEFDVYVVVNPKIPSTSTEKIYVEDGEGCLSINRSTEGIVPRFARITVEGYDTKGNKIKLRLREDLAIAFQHEIDHLNGILFIDHIDKNNPFKDANKYRAI